MWAVQSIISVKLNTEYWVMMWIFLGHEKKYMGGR